MNNFATENINQTNNKKEVLQSITSSSRRTRVQINLFLTNTHVLKLYIQISNIEPNYKIALKKNQNLYIVSIEQLPIDWTHTHN